MTKAYIYLLYYSLIWGKEQTVLPGHTEVIFKEPITQLAQLKAWEVSRKAADDSKFSYVKQPHHRTSNGQSNTNYKFLRKEEIK